MIEAATNIDKLREVALDQHGYVTYRQALDEGVTAQALSMLVKRGRLERVAHGVYRVPQVPASAYDQFMKAVLWAGAEEACLSHDTALDAYGVSDINPAAVHLAVNKGRRMARKGGAGYIVHFENIPSSDRTWWEEIPIVSLPLAIEQCIKTGVPSYLIRQAIERGAQKGKVPPDKAAYLTELLEKRSER